MKVKELAGTWELSPVEEFTNLDTAKLKWTKMDVPSHWQQHPDFEFYSGKMVYRKSFSVRKKKTAAYRLILPGIFYWSTIILNGDRLGDHEGYFSAQHYDITDCLQSKNELLVLVDCPDEKVKNDKRMITGVFSHWDCLDPKANPGGIWLAPEIHEANGAFLDRVSIHTESIGKEQASVKLKAVVTSRFKGQVKLKIDWHPATFKAKAQSFEQKLDLNEGHNEFAIPVDIKNPKLWWTHDLGKPDLYDVTLSIVKGAKTTVDTWQDTVGIRTIEVKDWIFYINGIRLYIKGNNYAPSETRIATTTKELVEKDLELAGNCNMNLLRIHAHVDHPELYRAADRAGVLLWQDFPLQWSYKREVLPVAKKQIAQMVRLLYNRPSVAVWCCHNEAIYLVDTKDEDFISIAKSAFSIFGWSWNRDVMDKELQQIAQSEDPTRFVNRSSGEPAVLKKGADTHFYFGWYRVQGPKRNFDKVMRFTPKNIRFVTEFGAQSFPNLESSIKFMDKEIDKVDWQKLQERNSLQSDLMDHWVGLKQKSLADLVDSSQEYQSRINQYYVDRIRSKKYEPGGGVVPFMFNDPNPAIQWSVIDYWRKPKKSYFALKKAFAPQYTFVLLKKDAYSCGETVDIPLYIVNDQKKSFEKVTVNMQLFDPAGNPVLERRFEIFLPQDCLAIEIAKVGYVVSIPGTHKLLLSMKHKEFKLENDYLFEVK